MNVVETFVLSKNNDEKPAGKKKKKSFYLEECVEESCLTSDNFSTS